MDITRARNETGDLSKRQWKAGLKPYRLAECRAGGHGAGGIGLQISRSLVGAKPVFPDSRV